MAVAITSLIIYGCATAPGTSTYSDKTICSNYSDGVISKMPYGLINEMVGDYVNLQLKEINRSSIMDSRDARAIWFDLESLKKFIYHIEHTTKSIDSDIDTKDLGIRIYYATYPTEDKWDDYGKHLAPFRFGSKTKLYGKKHTLIMIPTIKREEVDLDFNPEDKYTYTSGYKGVDEKIKFKYYAVDSKVKVSSFTAEPDYVSAKNHGGLFPPFSESDLTFPEY